MEQGLYCYISNMAGGADQNLSSLMTDSSKREKEVGGYEVSKFIPIFQQCQ